MLQTPSPGHQQQAAAGKAARENRVMEECKLKAATPAKKLVQARLPFKRLNPVPKPENEETDDTKRTKISTNSPAQLTSDKLIASVEDVENDCKINLDGQTGNSTTLDGDLGPSKLVNGKGPLDGFLNFIQKSKPVAKMHSNDLHSTIDLTYDSSNEVLDSADTTSIKVVASKCLSKKTKVVCEQTCNWLRPSLTKVVNSSESLNSGNSAPGDTSSETKAKERQEIENDGPFSISLLRSRVPVVVLKDIMADKSCWAGNLAKGIVKVEGTQSFATKSNSSPISSLSSSFLSESSPEESSPEARSPKDKRSPISTLMTSDSKVCHTPEVQGKRSLQQQREEKRQKLQLLKEERERAREEAKLAKERTREEAKRKKDEEKEQKDKERKEKKEKEEKEKAERLRLKEEKRKEKQDALEAKLEEKKKKEEEKRLKEEEKRLKAEKVKEISEITRFFQKPKAPQAPKTLAGSCGKFAPFEIKEHMVLAPTSRIYLDQEVLEQLDELLEHQSFSSNYFKELYNQKPRTSGPTSPRISITEGSSCSSDVILIDTNSSSGTVDRKKFCRMKLLQFRENHRPAYWGTWQKKSAKVNPRNPFNKDEQLLDYEVDSDDEWEEEEPGESLSHSEGDDDDEGDDEDDDDGFFVPHGYLSEGEGATEEGENPEKQKIRQRMKAKEWDELMKGKKFQVLQPTLLGCFWANDSDVLHDSTMRTLQQFSIHIFENQVEEEQLQETRNGKLKEEQILMSLLPLLHGNVNGRKAIIKEFQEWYKHKSSADVPALLPSDSSSPPGSDASRPETPTVDEDVAIPSKAKLQRLIKKNGVYEKRRAFRLKCWYVNEEVLQKFRMENLPVPGQWNYLTQVQSSVKEESTVTAGSGQNTPSLVRTTAQCIPASGKRKPAGSMSIKKFMQKCVDTDADQAEAMETDGFQADTEEDDDADCLIVDVQMNKPIPNDKECNKESEDLCSTLVKCEEMPAESCSELARDVLPVELSSKLAADETMDIEPCENAAINLPNHT